MTLTTRLSVVFVLTIGIVLLLFSTAFYWFANSLVMQQINDRAVSVLDTLTAAAESSSGGVEWEPRERTLSFAASPFIDEVAWNVADSNGKLIDRSSSSIAPRDNVVLPSRTPEASVGGADSASWDAASWLVKKRIVQPSNEKAELEVPEDSADEVLHQGLEISVAVSLLPAQLFLRKTAVVLVLLSMSVWTISLLVARGVCRRALSPLRQMTAAATQMTGDRIEGRLPTAPTRDELADLAAAFNGLLDRLQDSFLRQQRFTTDASHQLRTPLTAILGQIEVAQRRDRSDEEYKRVLNVVQDRAAHLNRIVAALLFLARSDAEAPLPDRELIDLRSFLKGWVTTLQDQSRCSDLRLEILPLGEINITAHSVLLHELFNILIDNAFKYSRQETLVLVRVEIDQTHAMVSIENQGEGVSPEDLLQLGKPFFRSDKARQSGTPGVGLGLSIAVRLASAMNGTLTFSSDVGLTTAATVTFPRI